MIPLPMIPLVMLCRNKKLMGEFVNRKTTTVLAFGIVAVILVFNTYLLISTFFPTMIPFS
jgi:manganese transport protein